jgi:hypothetical protein
MNVARWAIGLVLLGGSIASANTRLFVSVGWDGAYKNGHWVPIFVDIADTTPRMINLEIDAAHDQNSSMVIRQRMAAGPQSTTYVLFAPLTQSAEGTSVRLMDDAGHLLAETEIADYQSNAKFGLGPGDLLIGTSGRSSSRQLLLGQLSEMTNGTGELDISRLPAAAIGYDALDLLVLDAPDWSQASADQQTAIVDWVRAGGNLVVWPGSGLAPEPEQPLAAVLPCRIGDVQVYSLSPDSLTAAGLDKHYAKMSGRALQPRNDARAFNLIVSSDGPGGTPQPVRAWSRSLGFGSIVMIPIDLGLIHFNTESKHAYAFWKPILEAALPKVPASIDPQTNSQNQPNFGQVPNERRDSGVSGVMDLLGNVPGLGRFDFTYVAIVLLGLMVVVGPVDWFVLKWLGRQPWTWITTSGWIALVTILAISLGYWLQSGDLYFRTLRLIDEVDGLQAATIDVVGMYSPRSANYDISVGPDGWWQPMSLTTMGSRNLLNEIPFAQTRQGNHPLSLRVSIWNLKFLTGQATGIMPGNLDAKLVAQGNQLTGTITNHASHSLNDLLVRGNDTVWSIRDPIAAGATVTIHQAADPLKDSGPRIPGTQGPVVSPQYPGQYASLPEGLSQASDRLRYYTTVCDLGETRSDQIDRALTENRALCVYARITKSDAAATLAATGALEDHWQIIRALISLPPDGAH